MASAPLQGGCPQTCVGVGCEERFAAARIDLTQGLDFSVVERSPVEGFATIEGSTAQGPDLALLLQPEGLFVGSPAEGRLRWLAPGLEGNRALTDLPAILVGGGASSSFGAALARIPDLDGDGLDELLVGAPGAVASTATSGDGAVTLWSGLASDPSAATDLAALEVSGPAAGAALGEVVAGCVDLFGPDGQGEWVAGALGANRALVDGTDARLSGLVYLGGPDGTLRTWAGVVTGERAGSALSCEVDLTGDGITDLLIGAPFAKGDHLAEGAIYMVEGGIPSPDAALDEAATWILHGRTQESWLGWSVAAGDIDGDGHADVVGGAPGADLAAGEVLLWDGDALIGLTGAVSPRHRFHGEVAGDQLGQTVTLADLDGDGLMDLLAGAPRRNPDPSGADASYNAGTLYGWRAPTGYRGWLPDLQAAEADLLVVGSQQYLRTGRRLALGDLDGDGLLEIALLHRFQP